MSEKTPVFITSFNQLTWLRPMVDDLLASGMAEPIVVDNASEYEPLLRWLESTPCRVIFRSRNDGPKAAWATPECLDIMKSRYYIVTDSDLGLDGLDLTVAFADMRHALDRWPQIEKAGLALRLDDVPDTAIGVDAKRWERQFWKNRTQQPDGYFAGVDTTFAMYRPETGWGGCGSAWRSIHACRHMPWYLADTDSEIRGMLGKMDLGCTMWSSWLAGRNQVQPAEIVPQRPSPHWQIPGTLQIESRPVESGVCEITVRLVCESIGHAREHEIAVVGRDGYRRQVEFADGSWSDGQAVAVLESRRGYGGDAVLFRHNTPRGVRISLP